MSAGPECQQLYALNLRLHLRRARRDGVSNRSVVEMATKRKAHNAANGDAFGAGRTVNLGNLRIINDRFVLDVCSGTFHRLSETAAFILAELQRQTPLAVLVSAYAKRYDISPAIAERDVELFLNDLSK